MAVLIIKEMDPIGEGAEIVFVLFEDRRPPARLHVDDGDVLVAAADEVRVELVGPVVLADRETVLRGRIDVAEVVVGQPDERLLGDPVFGEVAVGLVPLLLDLLLRLEPFILAVPDDEVGDVLVGDVLGLRGRRRGRVRSGLGLVALFLVGVLFLPGFMDAEEKGVEALRPPRGPVGADGHPFRERLVGGRIVDDLPRSPGLPEAGEAEDAPELVLIGLVFLALEHGQRFPLVRPGQGLVGRLVVIEGRDGAGGHVPQLEAVAGLALGVDDESQARPGLVEGGLSDVADVDLFPRRELAQEEIGAGPLVLLLLLTFRGVPMKGHEAGIVSREGQAADLLELGLPARGQVDQDGRRRDPLLVLPQGLHLLRPGIGEERGPLGVGREAGAGGRPVTRRLSDREPVLLRPGDLTQDDLALAFERAEPVHEPGPVGGELGRADRFPGQDILQRERTRGCRRAGRRGGGGGLVLSGREKAGRKQDGDADDKKGDGSEFGHGVVPCRSG